ncbi:MAG: DUF4340 domain-containing protein [Anaerocolumna sp.]
MASQKKKKGLNLILLLLLLIMMILALVWVMKNNENGEESETVTSEETAAIVTTDTTTISTLHYQIGENEMTLVQGEDGNWYNYLDDAFPINQTYAANMASAFASVTATRTLTEVSDFSAFGLEEPVGLVSFTLKDGSATTIELGSQVPVTGGYYATLNEDGNVYILEDSFYDTFDYTIAQMTVVEDIPSITAENITSLLIENTDKESFEVVYEEESLADLSGFSNYIIQKPYSTDIPADTDAITTLFGNYTAMSFSSCVDYNATDLSKYGLDTPSAKIHIAYYEELTQEAQDTDTDTDTIDSSDSSEETQGVTKVNYELTLLIGGTNENGDYYAKLGDSNAVGILSASTVATLTDVDAYENSYKYINLVTIDAVTSMEIQVGDKTYTLSMDRTTETVDGEESQVTTYYLNDIEVEEDAFKTLYQTIITTVTEREIPQEDLVSKDMPYMTVTYHLITTEEPLVIEYLPYDQSYYAVNTNGVAYFLTDIRQITAIADALEAAE